MSVPKEELHHLIDRLSQENVSSATPRTGNKPYYIAQDCPKCGNPLVLADLLDNLALPEIEIWHDEFMCLVCRDGIYLDWPEGECEPLQEGVDWDEFKREQNKPNKMQTSN